MKKLEVYDPALCCPTGVCGPSVDPELTRIASALFLLEKKGYDVKRFNLGSQPDAFIANTFVNKLLNKEGVDVLPIILFNNEVVKKGQYPSNEELAEWFEIEASQLMAKKSANHFL
jgi:hypothetical protein